MKTAHPITPPPELVQQWWDGTHGAFYEFQAVATQAARWGADMELEACCEWLEDADLDDSQKVSWANLRAARRPKPPSLKEQALKTLKYPKDLWSEAEVNTIRRALEQLND